MANGRRCVSRLRGTRRPDIRPRQRAGDPSASRVPLRLCARIGRGASMNEEYRAAEALAALQAMDAARIEYKADVAPAILDIDNRDVTALFSVDNLDSV